MADRSIVNALAEEPQPQPTLADVVRNFLAAPRMQQFPTLQRTPGEGSAPLGEYIKSWGSSTPREPNAIDNALSYVPPDVAFAMNFMGPKVPIAKPQGLRAYHGSDVDFTTFDPSRVGTGAWKRLFGDISPKRPMFFLADNPEHASLYGTPREFIVRGKLDRVNVAKDLENWAKRLEYGKDAQRMIDDYFEGNIYQAMSADTYFNYALENALKKGRDGAIVDMGRYHGRDPHIGGKTIIVSDPSLLERVR